MREEKKKVRIGEYSLLACRPYNLTSGSPADLVVASVILYYQISTIYTEELLDR